ncbi:MORN repeat-containing protein 5 [Drosophila virilis]|uniref:MORN repeat-containing protein 5 n=1 Tax=Drosophila virilis TaxID=7244 RepID=B4LI55_DROVI|nr:MORN repeat-containing protein 5 [Drosophila virilis]EDW69622.1 uncharacterized protein Dvir_GJ12021 [Drosophila virilis]
MENLTSRTQTASFLTGSKFYGNYNELGMQDYGLYVYPDGTRYLGQFYNNRFHGNGTIELPKPYCVFFTVVHKHGELTHISRMSFTDLLPVQFTMTQDNISFENWNYCTAADRRFNAERMTKLEAVGPEMFLTSDGPNPPPLHRNVFDLGFGLLTDLGFLKNMPNHMTETTQFYVGCRNVRRWIRENCRHGPLKGKHLKQEVLSKFARQIMRNNLECAAELKTHAIKKIATTTQHRCKVCRRSRSEESAGSAKEVRLHLGSTSRSCSSIMDHTLKREPQYRRLSKKDYPIRRSKTEENVCRLN